MSPIKGLSDKRRLPRLGKIHLGIKHPEKGYPMKTDYFVCPPEVQAVFGEKPKELRISIPVEDEEKWCSQYYRCYSKTRGLICKGDGEVALRMVDTKTGAMADRDSKKIEMREIPCQGRECPDYKVKCKEVMNLQFLLPEVPGLGIWQIDTSSINSIRNINSTAELLKGIYGHISMLPLLLTLELKEVNNPDDGKKQTVYILNIGTNANLIEMTQQAGEYKKLVAGISLPVPDDERPDLISPEFEHDVVELPQDDRPIEQVIDDIWGPATNEKEIVPDKTTEKKQPGKSARKLTEPVEPGPEEAKGDVQPSKPSPKRDPVTIKNFGELYQACKEDFKITRQEVWKELGVSSQEALSDTPAEYYQKIASVRQSE
uniref:Uncharacterized protein n=1 Tax=viral metagenome TaxID=1070528 RepID=A0A6M3J551_9ZZZZ